MGIVLVRGIRKVWLREIVERGEGGEGGRGVEDVEI